MGSIIQKIKHMENTFFMTPPTALDFLAMFWLLVLALASLWAMRTAYKAYLRLGRWETLSGLVATASLVILMLSTAILFGIIISYL